MEVEQFVDGAQAPDPLGQAVAGERRAVDQPAVQAAGSLGQLALLQQRYGLVDIEDRHVQFPVRRRLDVGVLVGISIRRCRPDSPTLRK